jgi:hypothetical protein
VICNVPFVHVEDTDEYVAEIGPTCEACQKPFVFLGPPGGLNFDGAAVNFDGAAVSGDGTEARSAVAPEGRADVRRTTSGGRRPADEGRRVHHQLQTGGK